jgi:hypothetical protein
MDNIITGAIAVAMFLAFAGGLAESIGEIPFILIVVIEDCSRKKTKNPTAECNPLARFCGLRSGLPVRHSARL